MLTKGVLEASYVLRRREPCSMKHQPQIPGITKAYRDIEGEALG